MSPAALPAGARVLIVRMSALGDIVHTLPVLAALGAARPDVTVDWLVDRATRPCSGSSRAWARAWSCARPVPATMPTNGVSAAPRAPWRPCATCARNATRSPSTCRG